MNTNKQQKSKIKSTFKYLGIFTSIFVGTFVMLVVPYYLIPIFPIILSPVFISLSNLNQRQKLFFSSYPFILFIVVFFLFHYKTRTPRSITFQRKGWHTIIYNVKNEPSLKRKRGFRIINFSNEPVLLTNTKQSDIIPVSDSKYYIKREFDTTLQKVHWNSDIQFTINNKDSSLYFYPTKTKFDSIFCFLGNELNWETFFVGTIEEYFKRDTLFPEEQRLRDLNDFFRSYCNN